MGLALLHSLRVVMSLVYRFSVVLVFLFAGFISLCMAPSDLADANESVKSVRGLRVTFQSSGEPIRAWVKDENAMRYVLDFVAGNQPVKTLKGKVLETSGVNHPWSWQLDPATLSFEDCTESVSATEVEELVQNSELLNEPYCLRNVRIVRVADCRSGSCVQLRGLYAGRSPGF